MKTSCSIENAGKATIFEKYWPVALGVLLLLGLYFRIQDIDYGLPLLLNEDEPTYFFKAMNFGFGDFDPNYFKKPSFFLYFYFAFYYLAYLLTDAPSWSQFYDQFVQNPNLVAIVGRSVTVVFSVASIYLLARLGKRLHSWGVGLLAALMLTVDPTHVRYSPIVISDIPVLCMMLVTMFAALNVYEKGRLKDYLLCGLSIGLVISFKYNFFVGSALLAAHCLRVWDLHDKESGWKHFLTAEVFSKPLWLAIITIPVVVLCLSPYLLINFQTFWADLNLEKEHMLYREIRSDRTFALFGSFSKIFFKVIPRAIGWPLYIVGLIGWASFWKLLAGKTNRKQWLVVLAFPLTFLLVLQQFQIVNAKYLMPLYPFWFLLASLLLVTLYQRFVACCVSRQFVFAVLLIGLMSVSYSKTLDRQTLYREPDTRQTAYKWVLAKLKDGQTVMAEYGTFQIENEQWSARSQIGKLTEGGLQQTEKIFLHERYTFEWLNTDYVVIPLRNHEKEKYYNKDYFAFLNAHYQPEIMIHTGYPNQLVTEFDYTVEHYTDLYAPYHQQYGKKKTPGPDILILKRKD